MKETKTDLNIAISNVKPQYKVQNKTFLGQDQEKDRPAKTENHDKLEF